MTNQKPMEFWLYKPDDRKKESPASIGWDNEKPSGIEDEDLLLFVEKSAYTAKCREVEKLVSVLEKIRDNPNYGQYHDGSSEMMAKEVLEKHQQGEG